MTNLVPIIGYAQSKKLSDLTEVERDRALCNSSGHGKCIFIKGHIFIKGQSIKDNEACGKPSLRNRRSKLSENCTEMSHRG